MGIDITDWDRASDTNIEKWKIAGKRLLAVSSDPEFVVKDPTDVLITSTGKDVTIWQRVT
jgi:hypothetical protein